MTTWPNRHTSPLPWVRTGLDQPSELRNATLHKSLNGLIVINPEMSYTALNALRSRIIPSYKPSIETTNGELLPDLASKEFATGEAPLKYSAVLFYPFPPTPAPGAPQVSHPCSCTDTMVSSNDGQVTITGEVAEIISSEIAAGPKVRATDISPIREWR